MDQLLSGVRDEDRRASGQKQGWCIRRKAEGPKTETADFIGALKSPFLSVVSEVFAFEQAGHQAVGRGTDDHAVGQRSRMSSPILSAVNGVCSAGFRIETFPHASAGAIFNAAIVIGPFQGIICPQTPTGPSRSTYPARR